MKKLKTKDKVLYTGKILNENVIDLPCVVINTISTEMCEIMDFYGHIYRVFNRDLKPNKKYYNEDDIRMEFNKRAKYEKIAILFNALDLMEQFNGRTKIYCIAVAMGYENIEGLYNTYIKI